jgi:hypothetical protein
VDGTVIETVKRVAELSWTPKAVRIDATSANPKGDADERAVLKKTIEADRCYILDRGSIQLRTLEHDQRRRQ